MFTGGIQQFPSLIFPALHFAGLDSALLCSVSLVLRRPEPYTIVAAEIVDTAAVDEHTVLQLINDDEGFAQAVVKLFDQHKVW